MSVATLETQFAKKGQLRADFQQTSDAIAHCVRFGQSAADVALLKSSDGEAALKWPPSPPWQELHIHETRNGDRVLLLVGRAGTSHWSMAVSVDDARRAIVFDVACRVRAQPEFLGSTYRLGDAIAPAPRSSTESIELLPASGAAPAILLESLTIDGEPAPRVELRDGQLTVRANIDARPPATIRWKYCVRFAD